MAFIAPAMSLVAERVRSVGTVSGASRFWRSSAVFVELFVLIFVVLSACFRRLMGRWPLGRGKNNFYPLRGNLFLGLLKKTAQFGESDREFDHASILPRVTFRNSPRSA